VLLEYCIGLIAVCTGLLIIATVFTIKNYWLLSQLTDAAPGKHDFKASASATASARPEPSERIRVDTHQRHFEHYDSARPPADEVEWTGPVTVYTPADRDDR
jgi:hypothetical protein